MSSKSSSRSTAAAASSPSSSASTASGGFRSRKMSTDRNPRKALRSKTSSPFTDFRSYMVEKNRKLRAQFEADASVSSPNASSRSEPNGEKGIFHGVSIFVNGLTIPSSQELRAYMLKHGGRFENYLSRNAVTHIICSNLPDNKMRNLRTFSHGLPVVRPEWVLDCLEANRLLSCAPYQLKELVHGTCKQQKISSYFNLGTLTSSDANNCTKGDGNIDAGPSECSGSSHQVSRDTTNLTSEELAGERGANLGSTVMHDKFSGLDAASSSHTLLSTVNTNCLDNEKFKEPVDIDCIGASNQIHSTLTDPNFVENYFKSSRLHFIGTWRNRYWKRFSKLLAGDKSRNEKFNCHLTKAAIIHIDMDCFFVSVIIRNHPDLLDKPVAVCHSNHPRGTSEISSANYVARGYGVRAGMFVRDAKACCPHLVILPYDFEAYEEVADQFYSILHKHCNKVQALSCDEAFLDVTGCSNPEELASIIRKEIEETTLCTASAGIAENLLLARLASRSAKPNGQQFVPSEKVEDYLNDLPIRALPGIGHATYEKLKSREIYTCGQMRMISKEALQNDFGVKIGDMLWNYCRGIDTRTVAVVQETKSVGAEVNWGIRFNDITDCHHFLVNLCKEVSLRLQGRGVQGRTVTLKVKKRKKGAAEPVKFMGCGDCENMSRSITVPAVTDNMVALLRIAKQIFASFCIDAKEVRGIGLQISRLESVDISSSGHRDVDETTKKYNQINCSDKQCNSGDLSVPNGEPLSRGSRNTDNTHPPDKRESSRFYKAIGYDHPSDKHAGCVRSSEIRASALPSLHDLDINVIKNLPTEILLEMDDLYKGELSNFIRKKENSSRVALPDENINDADVCIAGGCVDSIDLDLGSNDKGKLPIYEPLKQEIVGSCRSKDSSEKVQVKVPVHENAKSLERTCLKVQSAYNYSSRSQDLHNTLTVAPNMCGLMPSSLSQADASVLDQLPEDVKADVCCLLPVHRLRSCKDSPTGIDLQSGSPQYSNIHLWLGSPPCWVERFKRSKNIYLNTIALSYSKSSKDVLLSSILESVVPILPSVSEASGQVCDEALPSLHELLVQYIELKIGSDIEELYDCFCLLKRFSSVSKLLLQTYNSALPLFQASLTENYGGKLRLSVIPGHPMEE